MCCSSMAVRKNNTDRLLSRDALVASADAPHTASVRQNASVKCLAESLLGCEARDSL